LIFINGKAYQAPTRLSANVIDNVSKILLFIALTNLAISFGESFWSDKNICLYTCSNVHSWNILLISSIDIVTAVQPLANDIIFHLEVKLSIAVLAVL
jgi:hypothetical protein